TSCRGGREVLFMDRQGNALFTIRRKGYGTFRRWEVCRCAHDGRGEEEEEATVRSRLARRAAAARRVGRKLAFVSFNLEVS
ncbi:hypothetical protein EI009_25870, partial [Escherichia coli]|nr:hypothetical protein [Escherichia coli]